MGKLSLATLKRHLKQRSSEELISEIADLFIRIDAVRDYYGLKLVGASEELFATYKARIKNEFFPARGYGNARLAIARKAVTDYQKIAPPPASLADLMLFYVEMGVQYTTTYGDLNQAFYSSMESMFARAVNLIAANHLEDQFEDRCEEIVDDSSCVGWGFHEELSATYDRHLGQDLRSSARTARDAEPAQ
jgi:hypothetical protein